MKYDGAGRFVLSTGRKVHATRGLLSIDADGGLFSGYDNQILFDQETVANENLTLAELAEVADYMIEQWRTWRALHCWNPVPTCR